MSDGESRATLPSTWVEPNQRPWRRRQAARLLVVAADEVLLFEDSDPGFPDLRWWVTPGGGIDRGESPLEAAVRELAEETGLVAQADDLQGPVAHRVTVHGYSDQVLDQEEFFFILRTARYEISTAGHTESERERLKSHRWWPLEELATTDAWIWPENILQILATDPSETLELGRTVAESTLPVDVP